jgi:hypothetical protein
MLRVVTVVQQIMAEFNGAVSDEDKIVAITNIKSHETKWTLEFIGPLTFSVRSAAIGTLVSMGEVPKYTDLCSLAFKLL